jgi:putative RecB family exonuclease
VPEIHSTAPPGEARPPALSPSRAADFKQCPLLYRFRAIDRLPERPGPAQVRGTLVHAVLERLYGLPAAQRGPAEARALVGPVWAQLCADDPGLPAALFGGPDGPAEAAWLASTGPLLDAYFRLEDPRVVEPEARELLVEAELESGVPLRGYIDRLDGATVVDYKTGAAPDEAGEARALFPMKFYALMLLCLRGVAPAELRLLYLTDAAALSYAPDEAQLRRFARTLEAVWAAIRAADAAGEFRPNPGPRCGWCSHRALCPAWGGVPPPYPGWPR